MFPFLKKDEPVKIHFIFDPERAAMKYIKAWRRLNAGTSIEPEADLVMFVARFLVDKNNEYLPEAKAIAILDELSPSDFKEATTKFMEAVNERVVPKVTESDSTLPREVG